MTPQTTSLYIGRFQPFHNGHLDAIQQIFEYGDTKFLLIGVGSAEENYTPENPFTAGERFNMIFESLITTGFSKEQFNIFPIRNINHYALWPKHVQQLLPEFSRVFSGSQLVQRLFKERLSEINVIELQNRTNISGTEVRKRISEEGYPTDMLSLVVTDFLKKIHAKERLQSIQKTGFNS